MDEQFEHWWARHHPKDWFSKAQDGKPVPNSVRLEIWNLCRSAWLHRDPDRPWHVRTSDSAGDGQS